MVDFPLVFVINQWHWGTIISVNKVNPEKIAK